MTLFTLVVIRIIIEITLTVYYSHWLTLSKMHNISLRTCLTSIKIGT